jgi:hypothetical protein
VNDCENPWVNDSENPQLRINSPGKVALITGGDSGIGRPVAVAFLACDDSSYMTGQVLHPNGGEVINGQEKIMKRLICWPFNASSWQPSHLLFLRLCVSFWVNAQLSVFASRLRQPF